MRAARRDRKWALAEASRLASEEWEEIDRIAQREALSSLPDTIEEFLETIEDHDGGARIYEWSAAFGTTNGCATCSAKVVDAWAFGEAAIRHYDTDEAVMERIEGAVFRSDVDTGGDGDGSLCAYHDNAMISD